MAKATYDIIGEGYARRRQPDPRIAASITSALGPARSVINVGAGAGSYEPTDRMVLAVEPSEVMIRQRPPQAAPCRQGSAEALPAEDGAFDAAMAVLTIHHWSDWRAGLQEMRRVARHRIVLLTFDAEASNFWLTRDYFPEILAMDRRVMPPIGGPHRGTRLLRVQTRPHSARLRGWIFRRLLAKAGGLSRPGRAPIHVAVREDRRRRWAGEARPRSGERRLATGQRRYPATRCAGRGLPPAFMEFPATLKPSFCRPCDSLAPQHRLR